MAAAVLRQLGSAGKDVAAVMGLTANYVATLHQRALREGTAALVRPPGRPGKTGAGAWERAREWRAAGVRDAEIARRLGVNQSTVLRRLGRGTCRASCRRRAGDPSGQGPAPEPQPGSRRSRSPCQSRGRGGRPRRSPGRPPCRAGRWRARRGR